MANFIGPSTWSLSGAVSQVVTSTRTDHPSYATSSYVDLLSASITPSSTSSRIAVYLYTGCSCDNTNNFGYIGLFRNSTQIAQGDSYATLQRTWLDIGANNGTAYVYRVQNHTASWIDSPSTTSSITYYAKVLRKVNGTMRFNRTTNTSDANRGSTPSQLILMEISG